jgi:hypothetical protein
MSKAGAPAEAYEMCAINIFANWAAGLAHQLFHDGNGNHQRRLSS